MAHKLHKLHRHLVTRTDIFYLCLFFAGIAAFLMSGLVVALLQPLVPAGAFNSATISTGNLVLMLMLVGLYAALLKPTMDLLRHQGFKPAKKVTSTEFLIVGGLMLGLLAGLTGYNPARYSAGLQLLLEAFVTVAPGIIYVLGHVINLLMQARVLRLER